MLDTFEDFAAHYRNFVSKEASVNERKQLVKKFVKRVEVGADSFRIHFIVDREHYQRELALSRAGSRPLGGQGFFAVGSSNTLTNGAPGEIELALLRLPASRRSGPWPSRPILASC